MPYFFCDVLERLPVATFFVHNQTFALTYNCKSSYIDKMPIKSSFRIILL